ncbi:hypothetical protein C0992_002958 [Termitomyces sp. T32_za158]|nr:hypothetical protein C0992_002958 [Termitomyces sp. T32_za158]
MGTCYKEMDDGTPHCSGGCKYWSARNRIPERDLLTTFVILACGFTSIAIKASDLRWLIASAHLNFSLPNLLSDASITLSLLANTSATLFTVHILWSVDHVFCMNYWSKHSLGCIRGLERNLGFTTNLLKFSNTNFFSGSLRGPSRPSLMKTRGKNLGSGKAGNMSSVVDTASSSQFAASREDMARGSTDTDSDALGTLSSVEELRDAEGEYAVPSAGLSAELPRVVRRPAPSPAGPTAKRAKQRVDQDLTPGDVDRLMHSAASGIFPLGSGGEYMRPSEPPPSQSPPRVLHRSRQRSASADPYRRESPDRIPSPFAHEDDGHSLTMTDDQLVRILQAYGLSVSRREVMRHLLRVNERAQGAGVSGPSSSGEQPLPGTPRGDATHTQPQPEAPPALPGAVAPSPLLTTQGPALVPDQPAAPVPGAGACTPRPPLRVPAAPSLPRAVLPAPSLRSQPPTVRPPSPAPVFLAARPPSPVFLVQPPQDPFLAPGWWPHLSCRSARFSVWSQLPGWWPHRLRHRAPFRAWTRPPLQAGTPWGHLSSFNRREP